MLRLFSCKMFIKHCYLCCLWVCIVCHWQSLIWNREQSDDSLSKSTVLINFASVSVRFTAIRMQLFSLVSLSVLLTLLQFFSREKNDNERTVGRWEFGEKNASNRNDTWKHVSYSSEKSWFGVDHCHAICLVWPRQSFKLQKLVFVRWHSSADSYNTFLPSHRTWSRLVRPSITWTILLIELEWVSFLFWFFFLFNRFQLGWNTFRQNGQLVHKSNILLWCPSSVGEGNKLAVGHSIQHARMNIDYICRLFLCFRFNVCRCWLHCLAPWPAIMERIRSRNPVTNTMAPHLKACES